MEEKNRKVFLKRLLNRKEFSSVINNILDAAKSPAGIFSPEGTRLSGKIHDGHPDRYPLEINNEIFGWVAGDESVKSLIPLLSYLINSEIEKSILAGEALHKYREINLLYSVSEKLANCLDIQAVAKIVLEETRTFIRATNASIMLLNEASGEIEVISALGKESNSKMKLAPGKGIAGSVMLSGNAEIVNDVLADPRYIPGTTEIRSLMCAPLKSKEKIIGVINISNKELYNYSTEELKLFIALSSHAASAIENAMLHETRLKQEKIKSNMERYLAPQLIDAIIEVKDDIFFNPVKKNIVILFSDIRNFSQICETLPPEKVVEYLNKYFTCMVDVIFKHGGTVNKFVGDMIIALFGAPEQLSNNEKQAVEAAIEMQQMLSAMPVEWIRNNLKTGIGINSGDVVVGNIGSPQHMDYTAIGDEVNVAARLQALALGSQIMVSRGIYEATREFYSFKEIGKVELKGKRKLVEVFELNYLEQKKSPS